MAQPKITITGISGPAQNVFVMVGVGVWLAIQTGNITPKAQPVIQPKFPPAIVDVLGDLGANRAAVTDMHRMLGEMHRGDEPSEGHVPVWLTIQRSIDMLSAQCVDLTISMDHLSSSNLTLAAELEDYHHRAPRKGNPSAVGATSTTIPEDPSLLARFWRWFDS